MADKETHQYSGSAKVYKIVSFSVIALVVLSVTVALIEKFHPKLEPNAIFVVLFVFPLLVSWLLHAASLNRLYDTLSTKSYITNVLQTKVSYAEAAYLKQIFEPKYNKSGAWITMQNVTALPEDMRRKAVMDAAKKLLSEHEK